MQIWLLSIHTVRAHHEETRTASAAIRGSVPEKEAARPRCIQVCENPSSLLRLAFLLRCVYDALPTKLPPTMEEARKAESVESELAERCFC